MLTPTRPHRTPPSGPEVTFAELLASTAARHPDAPAVVEGDVRLDWAHVHEEAGRVAAGLAKLGVAPGDRVVTQLPNWWETVVVSWGVFLAGAVLVPLVPIYRERELRFVLEQTQASAVVVPERYRGFEHARVARELTAHHDVPVVEVRGGSGLRFDALPVGPFAAVASGADDIAVVLYTSGTTAQPKGVLHSHRTLGAEIADVARHCGLGTDDRVFMASPLSHITGLSYGVLLPAALGAPVVLQERWDPAGAVTLVEDEGCTFTVSATPFLVGLTERYERLGRTSSLRTFVCGGADIPADRVRHAREVMGTTVLRTYGSTELPTSTMADPSADPADVARDEGRPTGGNEMAVRPGADGVDELVVRGPELFLGYLDPALNDHAFDADGFFRTGDAAVVDESGRLRITGRIKDIINRGGEKFSAAEVEAVLARVPGVRDVAIVAYPDPVLVERACACLVADGPAPDLGQLREAVVSAGLAIQKSPERLLLLDELPRTASGKIQRFVLRDMVARRPPDRGVESVRRPDHERSGA
ncbi:AMP-binding protein [Jatrophihabitans fulvus]